MKLDLKPTPEILKIKSEEIFRFSGEVGYYLYLEKTSNSISSNDSHSDNREIMLHWKRYILKPD